ncbi:MAG: DUF4351 domain-containing protein, partial [Cyanobacteria bacterium P01_F01_bin.150]
REEGIEEGREEGIEIGALQKGRSLILRQLTRRFEELPETIVSAINTLSLDSLESLTDALLEFEAIADIEAWLSSHINQSKPGEETGA